MRRIVGFAGFVLMLLCLCGCVSNEELYEVDISADELEARKDKAMDPDGRYARAESCIVRQRITSENFFGIPQESMVELKFQNPDKFSLTSFSENMPVSALISDGTSAWKVDYKRRQVLPLNQRDLEISRGLARLANPLSRLHEVFEDIKVEGCRIDDEEFYKLTCIAPNNGIPIYIYIDRDDYLIKRIRIGNISDSRVVRYSMYEGVWIADETEEEKLSDGSISRSKIMFYKLDAPFEESEFKPPIFNTGVQDSEETN